MVFIIPVGIAVGSLLYGAGKVVEEKYPPKSTQPELNAGDKGGKNGEEVFVGYTGLNKKSHDGIVEGGWKRPLFFTTNKKEAQSYAVSRSKGTDAPVVVQVFARGEVPNEFKHTEHFDPEWFEGGGNPLNVKGLQVHHIRIRNPEVVTDETKKGILASVKRALKDVV